MRILIVHNNGINTFPSGELSVIYQEEQLLRSLGCDVKTLIHQPRIRRGTFKYIDYLKIMINMIWSRKTKLMILKEIDEFCPDIIHFHSIIPFLSLSVFSATSLRNIPVVQTLHNFRWICIDGAFYRKGKFCDDCVTNFGWKGVIRNCGRGWLPSLLMFLINLYARTNGYLFRKIDRFVAVSDYVKDQYIRAGFPKEKIIVKSNGIELDGEIYKKQDWDSRSGVAFAGRVSTAKGVRILQYLIPRVHHTIHIVGDGPELNTLQKFCNDNNHVHVNFWGKQKHKKTLEILQSVVCTIVPSQCGETFQLVAAESLSLGTPIVASNLGALTSLVSESEGGILVHEDDLDGFVNAVNRLIMSLKEAEKFGNKGRSYIYSSFSALDKAKELKYIYEIVVNEKGIHK
jgi:glycosyltransferase involved in cell wall biosynthesis